MTTENSFLGNMFGLKGLTAFMPGGGSTLGMAICKGYADAGISRIILTARTAAKAEECASRLTSDGTEVIGLACDVTQGESVKALGGELDRRGVDKVHVFVYAPGQVAPAVSSTATLMDLPEGALESSLALNFTGFEKLSRIIIPRLFAAGEASVIGIGSETGVTPLTRVGNYSASKAALAAWAKWLAVELARKRELYGNKDANVRVNILVPGFFPAEQNRTILRDVDPLTSMTREASILMHTPMGCYGQPSDLVGPAIMLASPVASRFMTGAQIVVDGGFGAMTI